MCGENNNTSYLANVLENILMLQQRNDECSEDNTCTRPFLGPSINLICFNTRLISIYSCCNNSLWAMPYTLNGIDSTSTVFRIENLDDECATFRILAPSTELPTSYIATNDFFTIKLKCIGALKCLGDININGI